MNNSGGVSIRNLEASFDSGVGGGGAGGYKRTAKSFDLSKFRAKSRKIWAQMFRHLCSYIV